MARNARAERHLIAVVEGRLEPAPAVLANGAAAWSSATDRRCCMPLWRDRSPVRRRPARCSYVLSRVVCVGGQCGTGQGSATREGKLLLGHDVLAADAVGSQQSGRRIVLRTAPWDVSRLSSQAGGCEWFSGEGGGGRPRVRRSA